jgi:DNA-binding beta-propeller fold protein YncE
VRHTVEFGFDIPRVGAVDVVGNRMYLPSRDGLRIMDLQSGVLGAPVSALRFTGDFVLARDVGRVVAEVDSDRLAFLDATTFELVRSVERPEIGSLAYDPARQELYVFSARASAVGVFDAKNGDFVATVALPSAGASGQSLRPGHLLVTARDEAYVLDTATKHLRRLPLSGRRARVAAFPDAEGRVVFVITDDRLVAMDAATGALLGAVNTGQRVVGTHDPIARVILVTFRPPNSTLRRLMVLRHSGKEFLKLGEQDLPASAQGSPSPTPDGFVNIGVMGNVDPGLDRRYGTLFIWERRPSR